MKALCYQPGFISRNRTITVSFELKNAFASNYIFANWWRNKRPSLLSLKSWVLFIHSSAPFRVFRCKLIGWWFNLIMVSGGSMEDFWFKDAMFGIWGRGGEEFEGTETEEVGTVETRDSPGGVGEFGWDSTILESREGSVIDGKIGDGWGISIGGQSVSGIGEQVCSMTSNQGKASNFEATRSDCGIVCRDKSSKNSISLKRICREMYILWEVGSRQI